jgi:parallel beta-helix repeat protein
MNSVAIDITYGSNISVQYNTITNIGEGILVSNSSPLVKNNTINTTGSLVANVGIGMDYSYSSVLTGNQISNCTTGVSLFLSSPTMFENVIISSVTGAKGVYANHYSSPKLKPVFAQIGVWDGGMNEISTTGSGAMCINLTNNSVPDLDYGCNTLTITTNSGNYFVYGTIDPPSFYTYYIRNNTWMNAFSPNYINLDVDYEESPEGCDLDAPGGGGVKGSNLPVVLVDPPQQVIVNYGNNIFDTLQTLNTSRELSQDMALYLSGMNYEISGNFSSAFNTYRLLISNYQDSNTAVYSLKRLLRCKDRLNSDTASYISLRQYYLNLAGNNQTDTAFVNVTEELATKCLVRIRDYSGAITEYENVINSSNDSLQILGAELNIIETYMLMQQNGDAPLFTGQYAQLKPRRIEDGVRMIKEKLYGTSRNSISVLPLKYNISQNYPNPFNPTTKINYELPKNSFVKIVVYDILGREVTRLVNNEFKESGRYTVEFNGMNLASGVYFYRIEAGDFVQSKKMVLVK